MPLPTLLAQAPAPPVSHESTVTIALLVIILGALVAVSVAWGRATARLDRVEKDQEESTADRKELRKEAAVDRAEVRAVNATLESIVSALDDIRKALGPGARGRAG